MKNKVRCSKIRYRSKDAALKALVRLPTYRGECRVYRCGKHSAAKNVWHLTKNAK